MDEEMRVTTDSDYYEEHAESVELWSPGNPLFNAPDGTGSNQQLAFDAKLETIVDRATSESA